MEINLPPEVESILNRKLASGFYTSASDAIAWALLVVDDCEIWDDANTDVEELRRFIQEGSESGLSEITPEQFFAEWRTELAERRAGNNATAA